MPNYVRDTLTKVQHTLTNAPEYGDNVIIFIDANEKIAQGKNALITKKAQYA